MAHLLEMTDLIYDVVVVGAGVEGSATALSLVGKAQNCTVAILEQVRCTIHYLFTNKCSLAWPARPSPRRRLSIGDYKRNAALIISNR